jgi:hypothetical protein
MPGIVMQVQAQYLSDLANGFSFIGCRAKAWVEVLDDHLATKVKRVLKTGRLCKTQVLF